MNGKLLFGTFLLRWWFQSLFVTPLKASEAVSVTRKRKFVFQRKEIKKKFTVSLPLVEKQLQATQVAQCFSLQLKFSLELVIMPNTSRKPLKYFHAQNPTPNLQTLMSF